MTGFAGRAQKHCWLLAVFFFLAPTLAQAGVIQVRPTILTITPSQRTAVLSLVNPEAHTGVYQIRAYRWRQEDGRQVLDPSDDIIASPPMVSIPEHGSQIVRIGLRNPAPAQAETTYRLILEEVPDSNIPQRQGLNIALRLSFPLFVRAQDDAPPARLSAGLHVEGSQATVTVHNDGDTTARLVKASLHLPGIDEAQSPAIKTLTYILPGSWGNLDFSLPPGSPSSFPDASVTVQGDEGEIDLPLSAKDQVPSHAPPAVVP